MRRIVAWAMLLTASVVAAQAEPIALRIDGANLGEARTDLVPGASYAPLDRIAAGLGARLAAPVGGDTAALTLGGHVVVLDVVEQGSDPVRPGAVRRDGAPLAEYAAIRGDDAVWAPIAPLVRAFGADVAYLADERAVVVVTPRAAMSGVDLTVTGEVETLRLQLEAPVAIRRFDDPALGRTELLFRRATVPVARSLRGEWMTRVDVVPEADGVRVRIDAPGADLELIALPDGAGSDVRVRARPRDEDARPAAVQAVPRLVLDASVAAAGPMWREPLATLVRDLAERLRADDLEVETIGVDGAPVPPERRLQAAAGADLVVALRVGDLAPGEVRLWVLGEAGQQAALEMAIRRNAAEALPGATDESDATDALRREVLLGLVPDLAVGRRAGEALASALFQLGGFRAGSVQEAPLVALAPAAGRGVLIELSPEDLTGASLREALVAAFASVASGAR